MLATEVSLKPASMLPVLISKGGRCNIYTEWQSGCQANTSEPMDDVPAGGIMKCDVIAAGIVNAAKGVGFCLLPFI